MATTTTNYNLKKPAETDFYNIADSNGNWDILDTNLKRVDDATVGHIAKKDNPHSVTAAQVGLGNVDNTSDANKPISTATQTALNGKSNTNHNHAGVYQPVGDYLTSETDPTVPAWAKAANKPTYTPAEVGAVPTTRKVNGKVLSADVTLSADDVGAVPTTREINGKALSADVTLSAADIGAATSFHYHSASNITSGTLSITRGGTGVTAVGGTDYTTTRFRGSQLCAADTNPTTNGTIAWTYE